MKDRFLRLILFILLLTCLIFPSTSYTQEEYSFVRSFPSDGTGLWHPKGIAVDNTGNVYVADYLNYRFQKFTSDGVFLSALGEGTAWERQISLAEDVAVDTEGNVYVVDCGNNRIQKFDSNGKFLKYWGDYGSAEGQFRYPIGIMVDSSDNVYVADAPNAFFSTGIIPITVSPNKWHHIAFQVQKGQYIRICDNFSHTVP